MTDYCGCGNKANMLCRVCRTTPTCNVVAMEHAAVLNVPMPFGFSFDLHGSHTGANGVCPVCMPGLVQREYEELVRPVIGVEAASVFEMACVAASLSETMPASGWIHGQVFRSGRQGLISWKAYDWRGPHLTGISVRNFGREFATAAHNRRMGPGWIKVTAEKVDETAQRSSSFWSRSRTPRYRDVHVFKAKADVRHLVPDVLNPQLFVSTDGSGVFCSSYSAQYAFPIPLDSKVNLSAETATSLAIPVPYN
ncbi:hypothetical protein QN239_33235 [Mycolicibacterium sp. Y3]